jgi:preprotein translocase subunit SecD
LNLRLKALINFTNLLILDNEVITAPRVNEAINGSGQISGDFDMQEAKDIALMLRSGAFTAPVEVIEERHIGPSLGEAAVHQGLISCLIGLGLLFLFSILFYKVAGLFAFIVLLYNLLLILFALSWFQAALTLPGIAGIVLSIGMAIDASILIYERIKEVLAAGGSLKKAVDEGFNGALVVILDANITHFLVAIVLYYLGAGPIQGFAVTMIIGIIATLLTGLLLLRAIFEFYTSTLGIQKLWI